MMFGIDSISRRMSHVVLLAAIVVFLLCAGSFMLQKSGFKQRLPAEDTNAQYESDAIQQLGSRVQLLVGQEAPKFKKWDVPDAQSEDGKWIYDVFTPPRIYIHPETGEFEPTAYQFHSELEVPTLEIVSVSRPLFRYQLTGFIENSLTDPEQSILLLEDVELGLTRQYRFRKESAIDDGYTMTAFDIERVTTDAGGLLRRGVLTLTGENGTRVELRSSEPTYREGYTLSLRFAGDSFELTSDMPTYECEAGVITWKNDLSKYPDFAFEIFDPTTSTRRSVILQFYLPN